MESIAFVLFSADVISWLYCSQACLVVTDVAGQEIVSLQSRSHFAKKATWGG